MRSTEQLEHKPILGTSQERRDAWASFLGRYNWFWFCTFTFRESVHPERAEKLFHVFLCMVNRRLYGRRWYKKDRCVRWIRALEMQKRNVLHYHALIGGDRVDRLNPFEFMEIWYEMAGIARISPLTSKDAALAYVSKYVAKGGQIDIGGPLEELIDPNVGLFSLPVDGLTTPAPSVGHTGQGARATYPRAEGSGVRESSVSLPRSPLD